MKISQSVIKNATDTHKKQKIIFLMANHKVVNFSIARPRDMIGDTDYAESTSLGQIKLC